MSTTSSAPAASAAWQARSFAIIPALATPEPMSASAASVSIAGIVLP